MTQKPRGFTLTEVMITVAIISILAVISGVSVLKFRHYAKTAEATSNVGTIGRAAAAQYNTKRQALGVNSFSTDDRGVRVLCASASAPVPSTMTPVTGTRYQSSENDWNVDVGTATTGFTCLRFRVAGAQFYQYDYQATTTGSFTAIANGDLDGDGITSRWELRGRANGASAELAPSPAEVFPDRQ